MFEVSLLFASFKISTFRNKPLFIHTSEKLSFMWLPKIGQTVTNPFAISFEKRHDFSWESSFRRIFAWNIMPYLLFFVEKIWKILNMDIPIFFSTSNVFPLNRGWNAVCCAKMQYAVPRSSGYQLHKKGTLRNVVRFVPVYRRIYCRKFMTLSNQMSLYFSKSIRIMIVCHYHPFE